MTPPLHKSGSQFRGSRFKVKNRLTLNREPNNLSSYHNPEIWFFNFAYKFPTRCDYLLFLTQNSKPKNSKPFLNRVSVQTQLAHGVGKLIGIPRIGQITATHRATHAIRIILAGMPYRKNSPVVNCFES